jgi:hypothetical protein
VGKESGKSGEAGNAKGASKRPLSSRRVKG